MDPVSLLRQAALGASSARLEGRVESVDQKKGVVVVRLPGGDLVEAEGKDLAEGDKVLLLKGADGAWSARSAQRPARFDAVLPQALLALVSGEELSKAVGTADRSRIRTALERVAAEIARAPAESLPVQLQAARARGLPPLVSVGEKSVAPGTVLPLLVLEESSEGVYKAEAAGRRVVLVGAPGVPRGPVGLWTETVLQGKVSLWLPSELPAVEAPGLPSRISADEAGARRLLDHLGVAVASTQDASFNSLVRTLVRAAALAEAPSSGASSGGDQAQGAVLPPQGGGAGGPLPPPGVRAIPVLPESVSAGAPIPAPGIPDPDGPRASAVLRAADAPSASDSARSAAQVAAMLAAVVSGESPAPAAAMAERAIPPSESPAQPAAASAMPAEGSPRTLGSAAALRVACAWALSADEPSNSVLLAAIGDVQDLPEALHLLVERAVRDPEAFPEVAEFVERSDPKMPWMPHRIGLEKGHGAFAGGQDDARSLASAAVGDLARALRDDRNADAQVLREALRSIVGEGLDGARDPSNPMSSAPWSMPPRGERPDAGRVVVRDRRRDREGASQRTVVDVAMNPTGLGAVGARLEAAGKELDVRFRASEPATAERIREGLPELRRILSELGFGTRALEVEDGRPAAGASEPLRPGSAGLLDLRA
jgi:hypothetical protein